MMNSLTKIIAISTAGFIAIVLLVLMLAKPILGQIDTLHQQEADQKTQLNQLSDQLSAYGNAKSQLASVNYKDSIDNAIVAREDLAEAITEIEADAAKTNVTESITIVDDLASQDKPKPLVPGEKSITEVGYTLNFTAKFSDTLNFIQYMEHLSHFTEVSGLTFDAVSESSDKVTTHADLINGTITGVFFIKKK